MLLRSSRLVHSSGCSRCCVCAGFPKRQRSLTAAANQLCPNSSLCNLRVSVSLWFVLLKIINRRDTEVHREAVLEPKLAQSSATPYLISSWAAQSSPREERLTVRLVVRAQTLSAIPLRREAFSFRQPCATHPPRRA